MCPLRWCLLLLLGGPVAAKYSQPTTRHGKILPFLSIFPLYTRPRVSPSPCMSASNMEGVCATLRQCEARGGVSSGSCPGNSRAVCCVVQRSCGGTSSSNVTYFTNPNYPTSYGGGQRCAVTIIKSYSGICQLRIDFVDLTLSQPTTDGKCIDDFLSLGDNSLPYLCGENTNLHVYIDYPETQARHILIDTNSAVSIGRRWNLKITQISCNSTNRAPNGCLMYYSQTSGTVSSFNFGISLPATAGATGVSTRQLADLNYGVCVRPINGYCIVEWSRSVANVFTFTVSGDTAGIPADLLGTMQAATIGVGCTHNFILIPNPSQGSTRLAAERFCGNGFATTTTMSQPYVLTVVTSSAPSEEMPKDIANRGFQLNFRQLPCRL